MKTYNSYYDLCYCEELVATYRRIEFSRSHGDSYDNNQSTDIDKRILRNLQLLLKVNALQAVQQYDIMNIYLFS